jgi:hypothetical protein
MPEGERSFASSKGPRQLVALRLPASVCLLLNLAAAEVGMTRTALATELVERWAEQWLLRNQEQISSAVEAERERRAHA